MVGGHEGAASSSRSARACAASQPGDHVAASFFPICGRCKMCITGHTNLCDLGAATFSPGQISDGTVRYHYDGRPLNVMSKLGTFAEHGVVHEASLVKVEPDLPLHVGGAGLVRGDHRLGLGGLPGRGRAGRHRRRGRGRRRRA